MRLERAPLPGASMRGFEPGVEAWIVKDRHGFSDALAQALSAAGVRARPVAGVKALPAEARIVFAMMGLNEVQDLGETSALVREALEVVRRVADEMSARGGALILAHDTGGALGLGELDATRATLGALVGVARVAAREWPRAGVKAIDLDASVASPAQIARAIVGEVLSGGDAPEIAYNTAGERHETRRVSAPWRQAARAPLGESDVLVVTGDLRAPIGRAAAALARDSGARVLWLGEEALRAEPSWCEALDGEAALSAAITAELRASGHVRPEREATARAQQILDMRRMRQGLDLLTMSGARVRYVQVNLRDVLAVMDALAQARARWGPLTALLHGASAPQHRPLTSLSQAHAARAYDARVSSLAALMAATVADPLRLIALWSDAASRLGLRTRGADAAACEAMRRMARVIQAQRGEGCEVKVLHWGPLAHDRLPDAVSAQLDVATLSLEEVAAATARELGQRDGELDVILTHRDSGR